MRCPKCPNRVLFRDEDGLWCICGWREPDVVPMDIMEIIDDGRKPRDSAVDKRR